MFSCTTGKATLIPKTPCEKYWKEITDNEDSIRLPLIVVII